MDVMRITLPFVGASRVASALQYGGVQVQCNLEWFMPSREGVEVADSPQ